MNRIVLAYSGGLDTSVAIAWLAEAHGADVVSVTLDLGQGRELESVRERALAAGAVRAHVLDAREEFARRYVLPALQAGAMDDGGHPMAAALSRALIGGTLVEIARIEGSDTIAHGCSGQGREASRIEAPARALMPGVHILAPAREWGMTRPERIAYARARGITLPAEAAAPYRTSANLWARSVDGSPLADPSAQPPAGLFTLTRDPEACPDAPAYVDLQFERGVPVAVNGVAMPFADIVSSVATIAGNHGVGRADVVTSRAAAVASREIREAPAAAVLCLAHRELEGLVSPPDLLRLRRAIALEYAGTVDRGDWHSPAREAMDAFVAKAEERVTGTVRVRLHKGSAHVAALTHGSAGRPAAPGKAI